MSTNVQTCLSMCCKLYNSTSPFPPSIPYAATKEVDYTVYIHIVSDRLATPLIFLPKTSKSGLET